MGARLAHGSCRRRRDAQTLFHVLPARLLGTRATGGCWKTEPWTIEWIRERKICYKYLVGYCNNQGPDEVTKNWQKTETKDTEDDKQRLEHWKGTQIQKTQDNVENTKDKDFTDQWPNTLDRGQTKRFISRRQPTIDKDSGLISFIQMASFSNWKYQLNNHIMKIFQTKDIHIHEGRYVSPQWWS